MIIIKLHIKIYVHNTKLYTLFLKMLAFNFTIYINKFMINIENIITYWTNKLHLSIDGMISIFNIYIHYFEIKVFCQIMVTFSMRIGI